MLVRAKATLHKNMRRLGALDIYSAAHHIQSGGTLQSESYEHTNQGQVQLEV